MKLVIGLKGEYGNFSIIPEEGYALYHFLDYQSNLLIVSESITDTSNLPSENGVRSIPYEQFVIDWKIPQILTTKEWVTYFDYTETITFSEDGKLKETTIRIHEPDENTDSYKGALIEVETNNVLGTSSSVAFRSSKKETLIESYYESIKNQLEYEKTLELGAYPEELFNRLLSELPNTCLIIQYFDSSTVFELTKVENNYILSSGRTPNNHKDWETKTLDFLTQFTDIQSFWIFFSKEIFWKKYECRQLNSVLEKFIIAHINQVVQNEYLTFKDHNQILNWTNRVFNHDINRNVYWQFCPRCKARVMYYPRYPKHICGDCSNLEVVDENGYKLAFSNIGMGGGFRVNYYSEGQLVKETVDEYEKICFIDNEKYLATEARFGGVVVEQMDK
jgi:hypothetical protein